MARPVRQAEKAKGFAPRRVRLSAGQHGAVGALEGALENPPNPGASEARALRGILPSCDKMPREPGGARRERNRPRMSEQPRCRIVTANADDVLRYLLACYRRIEGLGAGGDASMTHPVDRDEFITK